MPAQVPLAELLPDVLVRAGEAGAADHPTGGWMLRRGDGGPLAGDAALAHQGVRDGDVLYLVPRQLAWPEPAYDDVIEEIAADARTRGRLWGPSATRLCALAGAGLMLLAGLAAVLVSSGDTVAGLAAVVGALVLVATGALISRAVGDGPAGAVAGACAAAYAAVGAGRLAPGSSGPDQALLAGSALVLASVVAAVAIGYGLRVFTAGALGGLLMIVGAVVAYPTTPAGGAAVAAFAAVAGLGAAPMLAVRLGRLPLPLVTASADVIATERRPERAELRLAVARADEVLDGLVLGLAGTGLACVWVLATGTGVAGWLLSFLVAACLILRARVFPTVAARLPLLAAGGVGIIIAAGAVLPNLGAAAGPAAAVLGLIAVVGLLALAASARRERAVASPYLGRIGDIADVVSMVALAPVACAVLGLFDWVRGLLG